MQGLLASGMNTLQQGISGAGAMDRLLGRSNNPWMVPNPQASALESSDIKHAS